MTISGESELRMALRHAREGRGRILRQRAVIASLRNLGLPTGRAEEVLLWLEEWQRQFEDHYNNLLSDGFRRIEVAKGALPIDRP
jgi:hypothetical protein